MGRWPDFLNASLERPEGPAVYIGQAEGLVKPGTRNQRAEGPAVCESPSQISPNGRAVGPSGMPSHSNPGLRPGLDKFMGRWPDFLNASLERPEGPAVYIGQAEGLVKPGTRNQRAEGPAVCESPSQISPNGRAVGPSGMPSHSNPGLRPGLDKFMGRWPDFLNASLERPEGPAVYIGQAEGLVKPGTRNQRAEGPAVCESPSQISPNGTQTAGPLALRGCRAIPTQAFDLGWTNLWAVGPISGTHRWNGPKGQPFT